MLYYICKVIRERMGPGGSCSLQNCSLGVNPSMVGSIPTRSRQREIKGLWLFLLMEA